MCAEPTGGSPHPASSHETAPRSPRGVIGAVVDTFLETRLSVLLVIAALGLGIAAILLTPREEEPQIVVPMADVFVQVPGAGADEVEKLVTTPLERLLWQIDGVEHVYSVSRRDSAMATVRFFVGEDREKALIRLHNAILMHQDLVPSIVTGWLVRPVEIDDVPIVTLTLHSDRLDDHALRRIGEEVFARLAEVENVSRVSVTGGRPREIRVELDPQRMAGLGIAPKAIRAALTAADTSATAGTLDSANTAITLRTNAFLTSAREAGEVVVGVFDSRPVYLRDIATIADGPAEPVSRVRFGLSARAEVERTIPASEAGREFPAVTVAVSKKKGTNAVTVARDVHAKMDELVRDVLPHGVRVETTRDYGRTAQDKVDNLLSSLGLAILTVVALLTVALGRREAAVVALAVPVSFALALFVNHVFGYTINRVTLFALILSLGLVVDDPITNVDNIRRHIRLGHLPPREATLAAVAEVLPPVIMSTLAIIVSFTPMFFITGMMGPYMAPMAANVPLTVTFSTVAALTVVPWLSFLLLRGMAGADASSASGATASPDEGASPRVRRIYAAVVTPLLDSPRRRMALWCAIAALLVISCALAAFRFVPLKMLPFDNRNEFQIVIDMPEGTPLEATDRAISRFTDVLRRVNEVESFVTYAGTASPMDFNGMVRHYFVRSAPNLADIRVNLAERERRAEQSHAIVLRLRPELEAVARELGADIKIVEVPPGPPVLSTLVAEIYGSPEKTNAQLLAGARHVANLMRDEPGVSDVDTTGETPRTQLNFRLDREKAALHGVSAQDVACALHMAVSGDAPATVHLPSERQPLPVVLRLPQNRRASAAGLLQLPVAAAEAPNGVVELAELGHFVTEPEDQPIHHKNLRRVAYVYGEMAGRSPVDAVIDLQRTLRGSPLPPGLSAEWAGEGEWEITLSVFRDLGLAFAAALGGIFVLLVAQTRSFALPGLIMSAIPLTIIGIMPGFWLLNVLFARDVGDLPNPIFFTATSMIGMIALGGIVIRNSLVLIEFIRDAQKQGLPLREAIVASAAVRLRPIVLTAATTALGAWPITLDPIFSGLAWALITGLFASTAFTLVVVPVAYYALFREPDDA
ncbi:multidrug efflux pump subunit AcrB [Desulfobaculum xiamenense]|uniref:Multidrug efflux pump subunit AcrB n=1 Tax=Desulfobaculum xiamenense TaxID=995050 RepID=A0A846QMS2_9BACT|nr:efflux RND transporter permease subunit [Desulfobaculum xiamenense]NJB68320.1 multidrug efflux pump subunit AcrB [Desulfobaculum xiamenense]